MILSVLEQKQKLILLKKKLKNISEMNYFLKINQNKIYINNLIKKEIKHLSFYL